MTEFKGAMLTEADVVRLTRLEQAVYAYLSSHAAESPERWFTQDAIAHDLGPSKRPDSVRKMVSNLRRKMQDFRVERRRIGSAIAEYRFVPREPQTQRQGAIEFHATEGRE